MIAWRCPRPPRSSEPDCGPARRGLECRRGRRPAAQSLQTGVLVLAMLAGTAMHAQAQALAAATAWLSNRQSPTGDWGADPQGSHTQTTTTAEALLALAAAEEAPEARGAAATWLAGIGADDTAAAARRIRALAAAGVATDAAVGELLIRQNIDGGWPALAGAGSEVVATSAALRALASVAATSQVDLAATAGLAWLRGAADPVRGGFGAGPGSPAHPLATAWALEAINDHRGRHGIVSMRAAALAALRQSQAPDGSFGAVVDTAAAFIAVARAGGPLADADLAAREWLLASQGADGSWAQDEYATAVAAQALALAVDRDADGMTDDFETAHGLDPLDAGDADDDPDGDGLDNLAEARRGTRPDLADSDGDGVTDGEEVRAGSDPADADDTNRAPAIVSAPPRRGGIGLTWSYLAQAVDADGDDLVWTALTAPAGMQVAADGSVQWTPSPGTAGVHPVTLLVEDGRGGHARQRFDVAVAGAGANVTVEALDTRTLECRSETAVASGSLSVVLVNSGTEALASSLELVAFRDRDGDGRYDAAVDSRLARRRADLTLATGENATLSMAVSGVLDFCGDLVTVCVDAAEELAETAEDDNCVSSGADSIAAPYVGGFRPAVEWQWQVPGSSYGVAQAPLVAPLVDTDGDGDVDERDVPAVVFVYGQNPASLGEGLVALDGASGSPIFHVTDLPGDISPIAAAVADIDSDGRPEIVLSYDGCHQPRLLVYGADGRLERSIASECPLTNAVAVADLDADAAPELVFWDRAYEADGAEAMRTVDDPVRLAAWYGARQVADLDGDGTPELLGGSAAYRSDGSVYWHWSYQIAPGQPTVPVTAILDDGDVVEASSAWILPGEGYSAVVQADDDDRPEVVFIGNGAFHENQVWTAASMYVFEHDGRIHAGPFALFENTWGSSYRRYSTGPPTVADFDGDGEMEVAVPFLQRLGQESLTDRSRTGIVVHELDGSRNWIRLLEGPIRATAYWDTAPPVSAFDFDGDGRAEIVASDQNRVYVLSGADGSTLWEIGVQTVVGASHRYPVVADVDNDGNAEIVVPTHALLGDMGSPARAGVLVVGDLDDGWTHARRIWNTWDYHSDAISEQARVPAATADLWRTQGPVRRQAPLAGLHALAAPDLAISHVGIDADACPTGMTLRARVGNGGALQVGPGVVVDFYLGDPDSGGTLAASTTTSRHLWPGEFEDVEAAWSAPEAGEIHAMVNPHRLPAEQPSAALQRLPHTWATASGMSNSLAFAMPLNYRAFAAIDGNPASRWSDAVPARIDTEAPRYQVHLPYPVHVTQVAMDSGLGATGYPAGTFSVTVTLSNGFTAVMPLDETADGVATFAEQRDIEWVRIDGPEVLRGSASIAELSIAGSHAPPRQRLREGQGRDANNRAAAITVDACADGANAVPRITSAPPLEALPDAAYAYELAAADGDGDALTWRIVQGPAAATIAGPATLQWTPTAGDIGDHVVTVEVSDGRGGSDRQSWSVAVGEAPSTNRAPQFTSRPATTAVAGSPWSYALTATDPDADAVAFLVAEGPAGVVFDGISATLHWEVPPAAEGPYWFFVEAHDGRGLVAAQIFAVDVIAGGGEVVEPAPDGDADGWRQDLDCDDTRSDVHPAAVEVVGNGLDDDCNPATPDDVAALALACSIVSEHEAYDAAALGRLRLDVVNASPTLDAAGLTVDVTLADPDGVEASLASVPLAVVTAGTASATEIAFDIDRRAPGRWAAVFQIRFGATTVCQGTADFEIRSTALDGYGLAGSVDVVDEAVEAGAVTSATVAVHNEGNAAVDPGRFEVVLVHLEHGTVEGAAVVATALAAGASLSDSLAVDTSGLPSGAYLAILEATVGETARVLDVDTFDVVETSAEICGNCLDDDGDGRIDYEDPDCCAGGSVSPLLVDSGRLKVRPERVHFKLHGNIGEPAPATVLGTARDVVVQLTEGGMDTPLCARIPAAAMTRGNRGNLKFRDREATVPSAAGIDRLRAASRKDTSTRIKLSARDLAFDATITAPLRVTVAFVNSTDEAAGICAGDVASWRATDTTAWKYP